MPAHGPSGPKTNSTTRRNVPFLHQQHCAAEPRACARAAVRRRRCVSLLPLYRRHAATGFRLVLADQDRTMDPRSPRTALYGFLFLHAVRPTLDLDLVVVASAVRAVLCA